MSEVYQNVVSMVLKNPYAYSLFASFLILWGLALLFPKKILMNWKTIFAGSLIIFGLLMAVKAAAFAIKAC